MSLSKKNLIFLGPPGAGKGTLSERFVVAEKLAHISTGQLLREEVAAGTVLGQEAKGIMEQGGLVSDDLVTSIVVKFLAKGEIRESGFILDGFPRTLNQARMLDEQLAKTNMKIDAVLNLQAPEDVLIERMSSRIVCPKCGSTYNKLFVKPKVEGHCDHCSTPLIQRKDDTVETAKERMKIYNQMTAPLIEYYEKKGLTINLDARKPIEEKLVRMSNELK